jgi:hypothetical protein
MTEIQNLYLKLITIHKITTLEIKIYILFLLYTYEKLFIKSNH